MRLLLLLLLCKFARRSGEDRAIACLKKKIFSWGGTYCSIKFPSRIKFHSDDCYIYAAAADAGCLYTLTWSLYYINNNVAGLFWALTQLKCCGMVCSLCLLAFNVCSQNKFCAVCRASCSMPPLLIPS